MKKILSICKIPLLTIIRSSIDSHSLALNQRMKRSPLWNYWIVYVLAIPHLKSIRSVEKANELRRRAIYTQVPDFFPTPPELIDRMLRLARIDSSHRVLDPSAGAGDLCLAVRKLGAVVECFEINSDLHQALILLGFQPLNYDFLFATPRPIYDRVLMNPPFSNDAYIEHVRAAYFWLAPGGELVAVLPNDYRKSRSTKRREFADWLDEMGASDYANPANAFTKSDRRCQVSTHLIHLKH